MNMRKKLKILSSFLIFVMCLFYVSSISNAIIMNRVKKLDMSIRDKVSTGTIIEKPDVFTISEAGFLNRLDEKDKFSIKSSNAKIAQVSKNGHIIFKSEGKVKLKVYYKKKIVQKTIQVLNPIITKQEKVKYNISMKWKRNIDNIEISWSKIEYFKSFTILRKADAEKTFKIVSEKQKKEKFKDKEVELNKGYTYRIKCYANDKKEHILQDIIIPAEIITDSTTENVEKLENVINNLPQEVYDLVSSLKEYQELLDNLNSGDISDEDLTDAEILELLDLLNNLSDIENDTIVDKDICKIDEAFYVDIDNINNHEGVIELKLEKDVNLNLVDVYKIDEYGNLSSVKILSSNTDFKLIYAFITEAGNYVIKKSNLDGTEEKIKEKVSLIGETFQVTKENIESSNGKLIISFDSFEAIEMGNLELFRLYEDNQLSKVNKSNYEINIEKKNLVFKTPEIGIYIIKDKNEAKAELKNPDTIEELEVEDNSLEELKNDKESEPENSEIDNIVENEDITNEEEIIGDIEKDILNEEIKNNNEATEQPNTENILDSIEENAEIDEIQETIGEEIEEEEKDSAKNVNNEELEEISKTIVQEDVEIPKEKIIETVEISSEVESSLTESEEAEKNNQDTVINNNVIDEIELDDKEEIIEKTENVDESKSEIEPVENIENNVKSVEDTNQEENIGEIDKEYEQKQNNIINKSNKDSTLNNDVNTSENFQQDLVDEYEKRDSYNKLVAAMDGLLGNDDIIVGDNPEERFNSLIPEGNGVWILEKDREDILELINSMANKEYYLDGDGFLKESESTTVDKSKSSVFTKILDELINSDKRVIIGKDNDFYNYLPELDKLEKKNFTTPLDGVNIGGNGTDQIIVLSDKEDEKPDGNNSNDSALFLGLVLLHEMTHAVRGIKKKKGSKDEEEEYAIDIENQARIELGFLPRDNEGNLWNNYENGDAYKYSGDLDPGDTGESVKELEWDLMYLGFDLRRSMASGLFDKYVKFAMIAIQKYEGTATPGRLGPSTYAAIQSYLADVTIYHNTVYFTGKNTILVMYEDLIAADSNGSTDPVQNPDDIEIGESGPHVKAWQERLLALGFDLGGFGATGYYGDYTAITVKAIQKYNGLITPGRLGPSTRNIISGYIDLINGTFQDKLTYFRDTKPGIDKCYYDYLYSMELDPGDRGPAVNELQRKLLKIGFDLGGYGVTGYFGEYTTLSLKAIQKHNNYSTPGRLGPSTLSKINEYIAMIDDGRRIEFINTHFIDIHDAYMYFIEFQELDPGDKGPGVELLQKKLLNLGFDLGGYGATGYFGSFTTLTLKAIQAYNGWGTPGRYGPSTMTIIEEYIELKANTPSEFTDVIFPGIMVHYNKFLSEVELDPGAENEAVKILQDKLVKLGFTLGGYGATSYYGNYTTAAIKAIQRRDPNILTTPGRYGPQTIEAVKGLLQLQENNIGIYQNSIWPQLEIYYKKYIKEFAAVDEFIDIEGSFYGDVAYYNQKDPRWKDRPYGGNTTGKAGCGPTAMSIIVSSLREQLTPPESCDYSLNNGFRASSGTYAGLFGSLANKYDIKMERYYKGHVNEIKEIVADGKHMAITIMRPGYFTSGGHFIVITGVRSIGEYNYFEVYDPNMDNTNYTKYGNNSMIIDVNKNDGFVLARTQIFANEVKPGGGSEAGYWVFSVDGALPVLTTVAKTKQKLEWLGFTSCRNVNGEFDNEITTTFTQTLMSFVEEYGLTSKYNALPSSMAQELKYKEIYYWVDQAYEGRYVPVQNTNRNNVTSIVRAKRTLLEIGYYGFDSNTGEWSEEFNIALNQFMNDYGLKSSYNEQPDDRKTLVLFSWIQQAGDRVIHRLDGKEPIPADELLWKIDENGNTSDIKYEIIKNVGLGVVASVIADGIDSLNLITAVINSVFDVEFAEFGYTCIAEFKENGIEGLEKYVTHEAAYYAGRTVTDIALMVVGVYTTISGLNTFLTGLGGEIGSGFVEVATVGAGTPAVIISATASAAVMAAGAAGAAFGASLVYSAGVNAITNGKLFMTKVNGDYEQISDEKFFIETRKLLEEYKNKKISTKNPFLELKLGKNKNATIKKDVSSDLAKDVNTLKKDLLSTKQLDREGRAVSITEYNIDGLGEDILMATSKKYETISGFVEAKHNRIDRAFYTRKVDPQGNLDTQISHNRYIDTEARTLEKINDLINDKGLNPEDVVGTINLHVTLAPCISCTNVIRQFANKFKNIKINVTWG